MLIIACLLGSFPVVAAYPCTDNEFEIANYQFTSLQVAAATLNKRPVFNPSARPTAKLSAIFKADQLRDLISWLESRTGRPFDGTL